MSTTYTATADAIVPGGAVQIVIPSDGDPLTAASNNLPETKEADIIKKIIDKAIFSLTPGHGTLVNGLLFGSLAASTGGGAEPVRWRIYLLDGGASVWLVSGASWNGSVWARDGGGTAMAQALRMGDNGLAIPSQTIDFLQFDTSVGSTWATNAWTAMRLLQNGATANAGFGVVGMQARQAPSFSGSWVNYGAPYQDVSYRKDPFGFVHLQGAAKSGTAGTSIFTLPAGYRPAADLEFPISNSTGASSLLVTASGTVVPVAAAGNSLISLSGISFG